jgi:hypothetical protein
VDDVRPAAPARWAAAGVIALALPVAPLAVAKVGGGSSAPAILAGGAASLAALAAWLGPAAWPGMARGLAVERVMVTAVIAWAAALDAAVAGVAVHGGGVSWSPGIVGATAAAYAAGSVWSMRSRRGVVALAGCVHPHGGGVDPVPGGGMSAADM